jgi:hypothetical protein
MRFRPGVALVLVPLFAACANASVKPGGGGTIAHATGGGDLLVRVSVGGGFVPAEVNLTNLPTFSLYGDGTLVQPGAQIEIYPAPALPAIASRTIEEPGIQAILRAALNGTDELPSDLDEMGSMNVADAPTTVISVRAGGAERTVSAYALSEMTERPPGMSDDVYRARQRLSALVAKLAALDPWLPEGSLGEETMYGGAAARLFVSDYRKVDDLPQDAVAWPIGGDLGGFGEPTGPDGYRCGILDGGDWAAVRDAATRANQLTPWTDRGQRYSILFRPLLPDESGC